MKKKKVEIDWEDPAEELTWEDSEPQSKPLSVFSKAILKKQAPFELTPSATYNPEVEGDTRLTGKAGRRNKERIIEVKLKYDSETLNQSDMLREVIAARGTIDERYNDPEYCSKMFYRLGKVPAYILAGDIDRWSYFIFAAETLRLNPDFKELGIKELGNVNDGYDFKKAQPELEGGVTWGGEEHENETVRAQVDKAKKKALEENRESAAPAKPVVDENDPYILKWKVAEKHARNTPRDQWEGKTDVEFERMIKWCYGWLRDIGEVPTPYPDPLDLFWARPRPGDLQMSASAIKRRNFITGKVMKFWRKSLSQEGVKDQMNLQGAMSYRVVLAAKKLSTHIEYYSAPDPIHGEDDDELIANVKKAALNYFNAHFPVDTQGAKPGPITTLDPGYVDYIRICRQYKLEEGTLLHEVDL
jgi:hypothetical protein